MIPFPDEDKNSVAVQETAAIEFEFAERAYRVWLEMSKRPSRPGIALHVFNVAMLLNLQACRLFRSIVEECQRGEGFSAIVLSRSLFETIAALKFVLARHLRIYTDPVLDPQGAHLKDGQGNLMYSVKCPKRPAKKGNTKAPAVRKRKKQTLVFPSVEQRAWFYCASQIFNEPRRYTKMSGIRGLKRVSKHILKMQDDALIAAYVNRIGANWAFVLRKEKNYSGLKIYQLASVLGKEFVLWYQSLYDIQCQSTHAGDAASHGQLDENEQVRPKYFSDCREIAGTLSAASAMMLASMVICRDYFEFHPLDNTMINGLGQEYRKRVLEKNR